MTVPVVFRRRVQHDLDAAFNWYEEQQAGLSEEFLSAVQSTFKSIEFYPQTFATVHEEVRRAIVSRFPFAAFYVVEPKRTATDQLATLNLKELRQAPASSASTVGRLHRTQARTSYSFLSASSPTTSLLQQLKVVEFLRLSSIQIRKS